MERRTWHSLEKAPFMDQESFFRVFWMHSTLVAKAALRMSYLLCRCFLMRRWKMWGTIARNQVWRSCRLPWSLSAGAPETTFLCSSTMWMLPHLTEQSCDLLKMEQSSRLEKVALINPPGHCCQQWWVSAGVHTLRNLRSCTLFCPWEWWRAPLYRRRSFS